MVDTIKLRSPKIDIKYKKKLQRRLTVKSARKGQQELYEFTCDSLPGSYDSRISIKFEDKEWRFEKGKEPRMIQLQNHFYIVLELSLNKFLYGHNIFCRDYDHMVGIKRILKYISKYLAFSLPGLKDWELMRIDISENFRYNKGIIYHFIRGYQNVKYPRRKTRYYENEAVYFSGSTTTFKIYHKGPEFKKHDYKRIRAMYSENTADTLQTIADDLLRCEVEFHKRKLQDIFGEDLRLRKIWIPDLYKYYDLEVERVLRMRNTGIRYSKSEDVKRILEDNLPKRTARTVYSTWLMLTITEECVVKESMCYSTYARHRKYLKDLNITYHNSDVSKIESRIIPVDFSLFLNSPYKYEFKKAI